MHTLAYSKILAGLKAGGLLVGDVDEMLAADIGGIFMPHGGQRASFLPRGGAVCGIRGREPGGPALSRVRAQPIPPLGDTFTQQTPAPESGPAFMIFDR